MRDPLDPTRKFSEGGAPEHRAALRIVCPSCQAAAGTWCPLPGATWSLCGARINAARMFADVERDLADVRDELVRALPTENERQVLRWVREVLQGAGDEVLHDIRYPAALELLGRLLTMKVNHNG